MKKAIVTHFDGDPFLLNYWLALYKKYWRKEADTIYLSITYREGIFPYDVVKYNENLLKKFREIKVFPHYGKTNPEERNGFLIPKVREGLIGLIESDGWIFGKGIVEKCFSILKANSADLVASDYHIIANPLAEIINCRGFARNFFFCKTKWLKQFDIDFMPRNYDGTDLDCFGYISAQIAKTHPLVYYIPNNMLTPDNTFDPSTFAEYKWLHIRQMGSSMLGLGSGETYLNFRNNNEEEIVKTINQVGDANNRWLYTKTAAFRVIAWKYMKDKSRISDFAGEYERVITTFIERAGIRNDVYKMVDYFENLINL